jgi:hypothetical protein
MQVCSGSDSLHSRYPVTIPADPDDDFNEPLRERQSGANDAIVCEGGCQ